MNRINKFKKLLEIQDDKTGLNNPHKGWYWHFIDNGVSRGKYRVAIALVESNLILQEFPFFLFLGYRKWKKKYNEISSCYVKDLKDL